MYQNIQTGVDNQGKPIYESGAGDAPMKNVYTLNPDGNTYTQTGGVKPVDYSKGSFDQKGNFTPDPLPMTSVYQPVDDTFSIAKQNEAAKKANDYAMNGDPAEEAQIRADTLKAFQAEIDAQNSLYADKLNRAKVVGQGRLGSTLAGEYRSGSSGSNFGQAEYANQQSDNEAGYNTIEQERIAALAQIQSNARKASIDAVAARRLARQGGLDSNVKYISEGATRKETAKTSAAKLFLDSRIDPAIIRDPSTKEGQYLTNILKDYGLTQDELTTEYKKQKAVADALLQKQTLETAKTQADIDKINQDIANGKRDAKKPVVIGPYIYVPDGNGNWINSGVKAETRDSLTPYQQFTATQSIAKDNQARTENAREMVRQANLIGSSYSNILSGGDRSLNTQAIITSFNKILDPTSVVRESEYDRTAKGQALISRLQGKYDNIVAGGAGVTEETLKEAADIAKEYLTNSTKSIQTENARAVDMANQFGLNPSFVGSVAPISSGETPQAPVAPEGFYMASDGLFYRK